MKTLNFKSLDQCLLAQNNRIIHQIWFCTIPNKRSACKAYIKLKIYRDSWKIKNPTWYHIQWNKQLCFELIQTLFPEHIDMYKKYKWDIQRCDAVRYFILYRYGGVYADMDCYCNRSFDEVLQNYPGICRLVQTPNHYGISISNALMYSKRNHVFWKKVHLELEKSKEKYYYIGNHIQIMCTTGPTFLNRVFEKYKYRYGLNMYPYEKFWPYGISDVITTLISNPDIYTVHVCKGSWQKFDTQFFNTFVREWKIIAYIIIIYIVIIIIYYKC